MEVDVGDLSNSDAAIEVVRSEMSLLLAATVRPNPDIFMCNRLLML